MAKYSQGAQKRVKSAMKRMEKGTLRNGRSGKKVTNPKQAIAIGLSEARKKGAKVPKKKPPEKKSAATKTAVKKRAAPKKRAMAKKSATATKTAVKKSSAARKTRSTAAKKSAKKAVRKTVKKAGPEKRTAKETTNLRSATAEMESPIATNHVQTEMLRHEDPVGTVDQYTFDRFTLKSDPRQKLQLSSKPKSSVKPSGKKPLWN